MTRTNIRAFRLLSYCFLLIIITDSTVGDSNTTDPFYPCQSSETSDGQWYVECNRVPVNTVKTVFAKVKSPSYIDELILVPNGQDQQIVSNVIGYHSIGRIVIVCPNRNSNPLVIHPTAFTQTRSSTVELDIEHCDFKRLDWSFLRGFSKLTTWHIGYASNLHFTFNTFPSSTLKSLSSVFWYGVVGINDFKYNRQFPAPPPQGLTSFWIWYCDDLQDDATNLILKKWITPTSTKSLDSLQLGGLNLTKVPSEVSKYTRLSDLEFFQNTQRMVIHSGAVSSTVPFNTVYFDDARVGSISPGAFQGDFRSSIVLMIYNNITTLDSGVFQTMLQQMFSVNGYLEVAYNPIDCSPKSICNLAWLIRDDPKLLDAVWSAKCSNGTYLYELNPNTIRGPNGAKCPNSTQIVAATSSSTAEARLSDPFAPCKSSDTSTGLYVFCDRAPVATVKNVLSKVKNPNYIDHLFLIPNGNDSKIIAGIIGDHKIGWLSLYCPIRKTNPLLVDPGAFTGTKLVTDTLSISNCDLNFVDWSFLKGFSNLSYISFDYNSNLHTTFYTFPASSLTSLQVFYLLGMIGMNGFSNASLKFPPPVPNGLSSLWIWFAYDMTTQAAQNLLAKWVTPTSKDTLTSIQLGGNSFTAIPSDISKYSQLTDVQFWENAQPWNIQSRALNITVPVKTIYLDASRIASVSVGAFLGDFKDVLLSMYKNNLATLNSGAFQPVLAQMDTSNGYLDVGANPLDCSAKNICSMAWLIRDQPHLLDSAWGARCSNGTYLFQLNPKNLRGPNGKICP